MLGNMRLVSTIMFNYSCIITHNNNNNEKDDDDDTNIVIIIIISIIIVNSIIIIMESLFLDQSQTGGPLTKVVPILYLFFKLSFSLLFVYFFSIFPDYFKVIFKL